MDKSELHRLLQLPEDEQRRLVLEANVRLHAEFADAYDTEHPQQLDPRYQRRLFNDLHEACTFLARAMPLDSVSVLDLGSGTGFIPVRLLTLADFDLTCVDLSDAMLSKLRDKVLGAGHQKLRIVTQEIVHYCETAQETYDLVTISALLHHVHDVQAVVAAAANRVKPRGVLYIAYEPLKAANMDPAVYRLHCVLRELDNLLARSSGRQYDDLTVADFHTLQGGIDPAPLVTTLQALGFSVRVDPFYVRIDPNLSWVGDAVLGARNTFALMAKRG